MATVTTALPKDPINPADTAWTLVSTGLVLLMVRKLFNLKFEFM